MARAARDVAALRAHADTDAWLGAEAKGSSAGSVIDGMGPMLPAWQILRQSAAASAADRQAIDGWLARLDNFAEAHGGQNSTGTFRGANSMLLGLMLGDEAMYRKGAGSGFYAQLGAMRPDGSFPMEVDRGLTALDNALAAGGPWIAGRSMSLADIALAPIVHRCLDFPIALPAVPKLTSPRQPSAISARAASADASARAPVQRTRTASPAARRRHAASARSPLTTPTS